MNNGWIKLHRKFLDNDLWVMKPSGWVCIWVYILLSVNHEPRGKFDRGEGFFQFSKELEKIGPGITIDMVKKFLRYAKGNPIGKHRENDILYAKEPMISTRRSTRGVHIKVLNYNVYQDDDTKRSTRRSTREAPEKHQRSTPIHKNIRSKEDKKNTGAEAQEVNLFIDLFKTVNPSFERMFSNKTERAAADRLLKKYGIEKMTATLNQLPEIISRPYAPKITSPYELERNLGKLIAFFEQNKNIIKVKKPVVLI